MPDWQAVNFDALKSGKTEGSTANAPAVNWVSVVNAMIFLTVISIIIVGSFL